VSYIPILVKLHHFSILDKCRIRKYARYNNN